LSIAGVESRCAHKAVKKPAVEFRWCTKCKRSPDGLRKALCLRCNDREIQGSAAVGQMVGMVVRMPTRRVSRRQRKGRMAERKKKKIRRGPGGAEANRSQVVREKGVEEQR
jgi:hypothetical protein